jgi:hypothetical protein
MAQHESGKDRVIVQMQFKGRAGLEQTGNTQVAIREEVRHGWLAEIIPWLYQRVVVRGLGGTLGISDTLNSEILCTARLSGGDSNRVAGDNLPRPRCPNIILARAGTNNVIFRIRVIVANTPENIFELCVSTRIAFETTVTCYLQRPLNISFVNDPLP